MALASAAFDQKVKLVFLQDGVFQLLGNQQGDLQQRKDIGKTLSVFNLYDIDEVYADSESIEKRRLNAADFAIQVECIDSQRISALIQEADIVMSF